MHWADPFEDPVPGCTTLPDVANYIQKLPKAKQDKPQWQAAAKLVAVIGPVGQ